MTRPGAPSRGTGILAVVPDRDFTVARRRNVWLGNGRAHIEIRNGGHPEARHMMGELERSVQRISGVKWARSIAMVGQLVVAFEGEEVDLEGLFDSVESVEASRENHEDGAPAGRVHPSDRRPMRTHAILLGVDVLGAAVSPFTALLDAVPYTVEAAALVSVAESSERVRRLIDRRFGLGGVTALAAVGAAAQGLTQGPLGLLADGIHRIQSIAEIRARNRAWERREHELASAASDLPEVHRSAEKPDHRSPADIYTDIASLASLLASVGVGAATRSPRRAVAAALAGLPKPALRGHEAFAAELARRFADRGAIVMDFHAFRKLDRIDTVVVEEPVRRDPAEEAEIESFVARLQSAGLAVYIATRSKEPEGEIGSRTRRSDGLRRIRFGTSDTIPGGPRLAASIASLREEDRTVALVSSGHHSAFDSADLSIGILHDEHHVPWGADLIVGPGLAEAAVLLAATGPARWVTRVGIGLSVAASLGGTAAAVLAPAPVSVRLAVLPVNGSALASMAFGAVTAAFSARG